jgi:hypothetical protein
MVSSGWMNVDEDRGGGFCSFLLGAQQTRNAQEEKKNRMQGFSSGWMNGDEDEGFCSLLLGAQQTRNAQEKTTCKPS